MSESRGNGGETEDREIGLVGKAAAVAVAEEAGEEGSEHHADKGDGHELRVLTHGGKTGFERSAQNRGCDVNVKAVEKHAGADEQHDAAMKAGDGETVEASSGVGGHRVFTSSSQAGPRCLSSGHPRRDGSSFRRSFAGPRGKGFYSGARRQ